MEKVSSNPWKVQSVSEGSPPQAVADETPYARLKGFRQKGYDALGAAQDALFELTDAVLLTPSAHSFAELSLSPAFRRQWPSVYEALEDGRPDRKALLKLYVAQMPPADRPVLAGDHTAWPRLSAPTLKDRTIEHQPTKIWGNKPITIGQGYSTLAWVPDTPGCWALPLLHERIESTTNPIQKGADQLKTVTAQLPQRPISLWDSEYGCAPFLQATCEIAADKLLRLRPNRCLWGEPPAYRGWGRPPIHGAKFKLSDQATWPVPADTLQVTDPKLGRVEIQLFKDLHFREAPDEVFLVIRIHRLEARNTRRDPKDLFLAWVGEPPPPLALWWALYLRRWVIEPWYHFAKRRLYWTLPRLRTAAQSERWSDLMPFLTWQVWLARTLVTDWPLPWQKPQVNLTPKRVVQSLGAILTQIGTPARRPKPRGKSPGWPKGRVRTRAPRYLVVKKAVKKRA